MPARWLSQYSFRNGGSVASCCVTSYCSLVSFFCSSASLGFVYSVMESVPIPFSGGRTGISDAPGRGAIVQSATSADPPISATRTPRGTPMSGGWMRLPLHRFRRPTHLSRRPGAILDRPGLADVASSGVDASPRPPRAPRRTRIRRARAGHDVRRGPDAAEQRGVRLLRVAGAAARKPGGLRSDRRADLHVVELRGADE